MGSLPVNAVRGVQAIADSGKRLLNLIESLLAFIRLDQGAMALKREPTDLSALLLSVVDAFRARAAVNGTPMSSATTSAPAARAAAKLPSVEPEST